MTSVRQTVLLDFGLAVLTLHNPTYYMWFALWCLIVYIIGAIKFLILYRGHTIHYTIYGPYNSLYYILSYIFEKVIKPKQIYQNRFTKMLHGQKWLTV